MRRVLQCKGQCIKTRRGKCREMRWECAQNVPALGTTFHSLALEGAGEFFIDFSPISGYQATFPNRLWFAFLGGCSM